MNVKKARMMLEKDTSETDLIDKTDKEINEELAIMENDKNPITDLVLSTR
jgi:hypothetical protein